MTENTLHKSVLRRALLADRQAIASEVRTEWDTAIGNQVLAWWNASRVRTLGIYWPVRGEPDLRKIYIELAMHGVRLALPVVVDRATPLRFSGWKPGDELTKDAMGVFVPAVHGPPLQPDALLVPCVGFNTKNIRLGYGGGFYDRTLATLPGTQAIGIAYGFGLVEFEGDAHDIALDRIITERPSLRE